jgi:hypothetical protein
VQRNEERAADEDERAEEARPVGACAEQAVQLDEPDRECRGVEDREVGGDEDLLAVVGEEAAMVAAESFWFTRTPLTDTTASPTSAATKTMPAAHAQCSHRYHPRRGGLGWLDIPRSVASYTTPASGPPFGCR